MEKIEELNLATITDKQFINTINKIIRWINDREDEVNEAAKED